MRFELPTESLGEDLLGYMVHSGLCKAVCLHNPTCSRGNPKPYLGWEWVARAHTGADAAVVARAPHP